MDIQLDLGRLKRVLLMAVLVVLSAGLTAEVGRYVFDLPNGDWLAEVFSLSYEANFPTWFSSAQLSLAAALLFVTALANRQAGRRGTAHWTVLGFAFLYISLDEVVTIHEEMNAWFNLDGPLYYGWILPMGAMVLVMGLSYLPFLGRLPRRTRKAFVIAGCMYVSGALLMEIPLGIWRDAAGTSSNLQYALIDFVEESLEITAICLFVNALVDHLGGADGRLSVRMTRPAEAPARDAAAPTTLTPETAR